MWFAYVDESFNRGQHWVVAVLVEHSAVNDAQRAIREVVADAANAYGVSPEAELHGHPLFHGDGDFEPMKQLVRARIGIYAKVFRCLVAADCRIILRGVSKPHLVRRYAQPEHPHRITMTHLIERVDEFVRDHALLVADEHHETQSTLLRDLVTYQDHGSWGYRGRRITQVVDTIHFAGLPRTGSFKVLTWWPFSHSAAQLTLSPTSAPRPPMMNSGASSSRGFITSGVGTPRCTKGPA